MNSNYILTCVEDIKQSLDNANKAMQDYLNNRTSDSRRDLIAVLSLSLPEKVNDLYNIVKSSCDSVDKSTDELVEEAIHGYFISYHASSNLLGYKYVLSALLLVCKDPELLNNMSGIYAILGNSFSISEKCIERSLRYFIISLFNKSSKAFVKDFGDSRPTPSEFLSFIYFRLKIDKVIK